MKAVLQLIYLYFAGTPAHKAFSLIGLVLVVVTYLLLVTQPQSFVFAGIGMAGVTSLFVGSSMMPLLFGRMARGHLSGVLPGARIRLLASALITLLCVAFTVPLLLILGLMTALGPPAHATAAQIARAHEGLIQTFWVGFSTTTTFTFWIYIALWFITTRRNAAGFLQGLIVIAVVLLLPTRQIEQPDALVRWDLGACIATLSSFAALFLLWPRLRIAVARFQRRSWFRRRGVPSSRIGGHEIDLLLGTASPWLLAFGQLVPVLLAARIGYYSAAVWLFYLTIFSTVAGAIAGQAAQRSRALWLRGDWSPLQLFLRVERSFWRHNLFVLGILLVLMVAIGAHAKLPVLLLATGLPLLILGTVLSTYLGLMITRGLRWAECVFAVTLMLALMAVAILAARNASDTAVTIVLESALALIGLGLRSLARARWAGIDWMQCRPERALAGRSAA